MPPKQRTHKSRAVTERRWERLALFRSQLLQRTYPRRAASLVWDHGQVHKLFLMSRSRIEHFRTPGGDCRLADPLKPALSTDALSRRSGGLCVSMIVQPLTDTVPVPVNVVPPQQNLYSPVIELNNNTFAGLPSSCRHTSNTVTLKLQLAVLPAVSVAVHITVVDPVGMHAPLGGTHTTCTPGQSSIAVGGA